MASNLSDTCIVEPLEKFLWKIRLKKTQVTLSWKSCLQAYSTRPKYLLFQCEIPILI